MGRLQEEGINCWLKDENTLTLNPIWSGAMGGIRLMVAETQAERAADLLTKYKQERKAQTPCPNCGSTETEFISSPKKPMNWFAALGSFFAGDYALAAKRNWNCFTCGKEWEKKGEDQT